MTVPGEGPSFYEILGASRDASSRELKRAWRCLAGRLHPDRGGDEAAFLLAKEAYDTLSDPNRRLAYDRRLDALSARNVRREHIESGSASFRPTGGLVYRLWCRHPQWFVSVGAGAAMLLAPHFGEDEIAVGAAGVVLLVAGLLGVHGAGILRNSDRPRRALGLLGAQIGAAIGSLGSLKRRRDTARRR